MVDQAVDDIGRAAEALNSAGYQVSGFSAYKRGGDTEYVVRGEDPEQVISQFLDDLPEGKYEQDWKTSWQMEDLIEFMTTGSMDALGDLVETVYQEFKVGINLEESDIQPETGYTSVEYNFGLPEGYFDVDFLKAGPISGEQVNERVEDVRDTLSEEGLDIR